MKSLRPIDLNVFPEIKSKLVMLILIQNGVATYAQGVGEKQETLRAYINGSPDILLATWQGKWKTDVFAVDDKTYVEWVAQL